MGLLCSVERLVLGWVVLGWGVLRAEEVSALMLRGIRATHKGHYQEAFHIFKQAHKQGDLLGSAYLGHMYLFGVGDQKKPLQNQDVAIDHEQSPAF